MKVKALKELCNEDWKTQSVLNYPNIPKGTVLEIENTITNFYGKYHVVEYGGHIYYINPRDVEEYKPRKWLINFIEAGVGSNQYIVDRDYVETQLKRYEEGKHTLIWVENKCFHVKYLSSVEFIKEVKEHEDE